MRDDAAECNTVMPLLCLLEIERGVTGCTYASKFSWKFSYSCIHCLLACGHASEMVRGNRKQIEAAREREKAKEREREKVREEAMNMELRYREGEEWIRKNNKAGRQRSAVQQRYARLIADVTTCSETAGTVDL